MCGVWELAWKGEEERLGPCGLEANSSARGGFGKQAYIGKRKLMYHLPRDGFEVVLERIVNIIVPTCSYKSISPSNTVVNEFGVATSHSNLPFSSGEVAYGYAR